MYKRIVHFKVGSFDILEKTCSWITSVVALTLSMFSGMSDYDKEAFCLEVNPLNVPKANKWWQGLHLSSDCVNKWLWFCQNRKSICHQQLINIQEMYRSQFLLLAKVCVWQHGLLQLSQIPLCVRELVMAKWQNCHQNISCKTFICRGIEIPSITVLVQKSYFLGYCEWRRHLPASCEQASRYLYLASCTGRFDIFKIITVSSCMELTWRLNCGCSRRIDNPLLQDGSDLVLINPLAVTFCSLIPFPLAMDSIRVCVFYKQQCDQLLWVAWVASHFSPLDKTH